MVSFGTMETALDYVVRVLTGDNTKVMYVLGIENNDVYEVTVFNKEDKVKLIRYLNREYEGNDGLYAEAFEVWREDNCAAIDRLIGDGIDFIKSNEFETIGLNEILDGDSKFFRSALRIEIDEKGKFFLV